MSSQSVEARSDPSAWQICFVHVMISPDLAIGGAASFAYTVGARLHVLTSVKPE